MDLSLISKAKDVSEPKEIESSDPRLGEIANFAMEDKVGEAAKIYEGMLKDGIYDVRPLGYYYYHYFVTKGFGGFYEVLQNIDSFFDNAVWRVFGPEKKKEKHWDRALTWFFKNMTRIVRYAEKQQFERFNSWVQTISLEDIENSGALGRTINRELNKRVRGSQASQSLLAALEIVNSLKPMKISEQDEQEGDIPESDDSDAEPEVTEEAESNSEEPEVKAATPVAKVEVKRDPWLRSAYEGHVDPVIPFVEGSHALTQLMKRMQAIETLMETRQVLKAAIIAASIENEIENFNPLRYLPKLFAGYTRCLSEHASEFETCWEEQDTLRWKAMQKHFEADLESFLKDH